MATSGRHSPRHSRRQVWGRDGTCNFCAASRHGAQAGTDRQLTQFFQPLPAQVSISDDGKTTSFDITSTDVAALASTKQRWAVQCKPINPWTASVDWSVITHAASGGRPRAGRQLELGLSGRVCMARLGGPFPCSCTASMRN